MKMCVFVAQVLLIANLHISSSKPFLKSDLWQNKKINAAKISDSTKAANKRLEYEYGNRKIRTRKPSSAKTYYSHNCVNISKKEDETVRKFRIKRDFDKTSYLIKQDTTSSIIDSSEGNIRRTGENNGNVSITGPNNSTEINNQINSTNINKLMEHFLNNYYVKKVLGHRSKDAVWAALCLGFLMCLLLLALFCSKPWRDPYQQSWLHERPIVIKKPTMSVPDILKNKRKYLPLSNLKKKRTLKKKQNTRLELQPLVNSDTDTEDFNSL